MVYFWPSFDQLSNLYIRHQSHHNTKKCLIIVKTAVKAANLIGDGLYGVDLKKIDNKVYVIEVNDNPSITSGVEDAILQQDLYRIIIESFYERLEKSRMVKEVQL